MWQEFQDKLFTDHYTRLLWIAAVVLFSITFLLVRFKIHPTGAAVPLHYNVVVGVDSVGSGLTLYRIPLVGVFVWLLNSILARTVLRRQPNIAFFSALTTCMVEGALLFAVVFLLRVV